VLYGWTDSRFQEAKRKKPMMIAHGKRVVIKSNNLYARGKYEGQSGTVLGDSGPAVAPLEYEVRLDSGEIVRFLTEDYLIVI
jgi:hypothetical protein